LPKEKRCAGAIDDIPREASAAHRRGGAMNRLWPVLLPELRQFAASEQDEAFRAARETALDIFELIGMAAGLVLATALTKFSLTDADMSTRFGMTILNLIVALPLLAVCLGPFHLRRLRRGLRDQLQRRGQP
jgi:hypothetical protein